MSEPHDFTVRKLCHSSADMPRPSHPASRFVTIAHTPLLPRRDGAKCAADLGERSMPTGCGRLTRRAIDAWHVCATGDACASRARRSRASSHPTLFGTRYRGPHGSRRRSAPPHHEGRLCKPACSESHPEEPAAGRRLEGWAASRHSRQAHDGGIYSAASCRGAGGGLARSATSWAWRVLASFAAFSFTGP